MMIIIIAVFGQSDRDLQISFLPEHHHCKHDHHDNHHHHSMIMICHDHLHCNMNCNECFDYTPLVLVQVGEGEKPGNGTIIRQRKNIKQKIIKTQL